MKVRYPIIFALIFSFISACGATKPALTLEQKLALARHLADEAAQGKAETGRVLTGDFDFSKELKRFRELGKMPDSTQTSITEDSDITEESPTSVAEKSTSQNKEKDDGQGEKKYVVDMSKDFVNGYYTGIVGGDEKAIQARRKDIEELVKIEKKLSELPNYFSYKGRLFDLWSNDYKAHSTMIYALNEFEKVFDRYFPNNDNQLVLLKKISVRISAEKNPKRNTVLSISDKGDFNLLIAWSKSLRIEEMCDAVADAVLSNIAYENGDKNTSKKLPIWLKMATAGLLEQSIRFGLATEMAEIASNTPPLMPSNIFAISDNSKITQSHSYWTLVALEKAVKDKSAYSDFIKDALSGDSPKSLAEKMKAFKPQRYEFDLWWRCLITGEIWARMGGVLSPERAKTEVARLAVLQINTVDGQRTGVSVAKLWDKRELLKNEIKQRLLEIKVALSNVNPIYFNSLLSLGRMYETLQNDSQSDFEDAKKQFIFEYKLAQATATRTKEMIK